MDIVIPNSLVELNGIEVHLIGRVVGTPYLNAPNPLFSKKSRDAYSLIIRGESVARFNSQIVPLGHS
jgi:hypothetical protein